jgi:hypothetical protein
MKTEPARGLAILALLAAMLVAAPRPVHAFIYKTGDDRIPTGLTGGLRWDANPRMVNGEDRSLTSGLSWNVQGGSFAAYKAQFSWAGTAPSDEDFEGAIRQAFAFWASVDTNPIHPVAAPFSFVYSPSLDPTVICSRAILASPAPRGARSPRRS